MELHLKLLVEFGVHVQPDEYGLCEACSGHRGCRAVTEAGPQAPSRVPAPSPPHPHPAPPAHSPARANSTSILGSVAENRTVCWPPGRRLMISCSCSANPISKSL